WLPHPTKLRVYVYELPEAISFRKPWHDVPFAASIRQPPSDRHQLLVHFAQAGRHSRGGQPGQLVHSHEDSAFEAASREFDRLVVPEGGPDNERLRFRGFPAYSLESIRMEREPCFRPEQDVAIPNYLERGWLGHLLDAYQYENGSLGIAQHKRRERPYLLYFNGYTKPDMAYSGGVRQGFLAMFGNMTRPDVIINKGGGAQQMLQARFCLCPLGYGWGIRVTQALHTGCVPVLVQDHVYPAFWDLVPYEQFSVRINRHNLHRIFDLLEAITPEQLEDLQQGLAKWHKHFVWHTDVGGLAYNNTVSSLHRRLTHMWTALFRAAS
ncbi:putative glycosyltransferase, partial [Tetrabaena socialis]